MVTHPPSSSRYWRTGVHNTARMAIIFATMFLLAGRLDYWQGWVLVGIMIVYLVVSAIAFRTKTEVINERRRPGPGVKGWDRVFYRLYIPLLLSLFVLAVLDGGRYRWSPPLPAPLYLAACLMFVLGIGLMSWAMWTNTFFSTMVRIQKDRGHQVVREGPYRFVRHPGYLASLPILLGLSLVLGSLWGLVPGALILILLAVRTHLEDTTLQRELAGYADYARDVRYRLLPWVW